VKPAAAKFTFFIAWLAVLALRETIGQSSESLSGPPTGAIQALYVLNGALCAATVLLIASVWLWDVGQNKPEFRFRKYVRFRMLLPFAAAFSLWAAEYFVRAGGYNGALLAISLYGVPLLLALSGFEMVGLKDGERVHPLLGAYVPSSLTQHPLRWLTPRFVLLIAVALMALLLGILIPAFWPDRKTLALIIEASFNSAAVCVFGFGLLRILNARIFDVISSWPAFLFFFYAAFQWAILARPYIPAGAAFAPLVFSVSLLLKTCFVVSLLNILSSVRSLSRNRAKIMVSYRRDDSGKMTGRIYDRLADTFGVEQVFRDIDSIPLGIVFRDYIRVVISTCAVVVVIIGRDWLTVKDKRGNRRLDNSEDLLRLEIALALERGIPVIPVSVDLAPTPPIDSLPKDIQGLVERHGMSVDDDPRFHGDVGRLIAGLRRILDAN
jgi:hypothetical protein